MKPLYTFLDALRNTIRNGMRWVAVGLNRLSRGKLQPNYVTLIGVTAHLPIALLIADQQYRWAALLLVVFGLFDTLDGELARLQGRTSAGGMLLDATTDRMKEVLLYTGVAYALAHTGRLDAAAWAVAAAGGSLLVSYVKAKGETAIASSMSPTEANRAFQDGIMRFEVRMAALVIALLTQQLLIGTMLVAVLSWLQAIGRLHTITRRLGSHD